MITDTSAQSQGADQAPHPRRKIFRILIVDTMDWKAPYPPGDPLTQPGAWFDRSFASLVPCRVKNVHWSSRMQPWKEFPFDISIITGSIRNARKEDHASRRLMEWIEWCLINERPILGICYGHQLLAKMAGARIVSHPHGLQVGNLDLTFNARNGLPDCAERFFANRWLTSHLDMVDEPVSGMEVIASSRATPVEAFTLGPCGLGLQFHPEMDGRILEFLWNPHLNHPGKECVSGKIGAAESPGNPAIFGEFIRDWAYRLKTD